MFTSQLRADSVESFLQCNPNIKYLLVAIEPNLTSQSNLTPSEAAAIWPGHEAISAHTGVQIVGPQITWGTRAGYIAIRAAFMKP